MPDAAMPPLRASRPKLPPLTQENKKAIIELAYQGMVPKDIARQLGLHGHQVNGIYQAYKRFHNPNWAPASESPAGTTENPEMAETPQPTVTPAPVPPPVVMTPMHPVPPPRSRSDQGEWGGGRSVQIDSGGFTSSFSELRWVIERLQPQDGVLGTHYGPLTLEDIGQTYGSGTYRITKQEPGKTTGIEWVRKLSDTYGPSKSPRNSPSQPGAPVRPFQRPWEHQQQESGETPHMPWRRPFFGHAVDRNPGDSNVASEAMRQMGQIQQKLMDQHKDTPDSRISEFIATQAQLQNQRFEEERKREEDRRRAEEEKWERRQAEDRTRWEREQLAARDAHDREMLRIKAENDARLKELQLQAEEREKREQERQKFLLDLEEKRLQLVRTEAENQQKRLESELTRTREEMGKVQDRTNQELRETRESTQKALEQNQSDLDDRMEREREILEREFKIREKSLEREHELNREILNIQKQQVENQTGDQLFNMIQTFVKEASKGLEKICDLKKLEAMTPEAQAAAVARGTIDGNVLSGGPAPKPEQAQASQAPPGAEPAQESAPPPIDGASGIEVRVHKILENPQAQALFRDIVQEWAQHIEVGNDPSIFATLYLEMLQNQKDAESRLFCTVLFTLMSARPWAKMHGFLKTYLTPEAETIFSKPEAEEFYEAFRAMVHAQMKQYWINLANAAGRPAAPAAEQKPQFAEVPVEPVGEGASPEEEKGPEEPLVAVEEPTPPPQAS